MKTKKSLYHNFEGFNINNYGLRETRTTIFWLKCCFMQIRVSLQNWTEIKIGSKKDTKKESSKRCNEIEFIQPPVFFSMNNCLSDFKNLLTVNTEENFFPLECSLNRRNIYKVWFGNQISILVFRHSLQIFDPEIDWKERKKGKKIMSRSFKIRWIWQHMNGHL
jgi:hypothetical protein